MILQVVKERGIMTILQVIMMLPPDLILVLVHQLGKGGTTINHNGNNGSKDNSATLGNTIILNYNKFGSLQDTARPSQLTRLFSESDSPEKSKSELLTSSQDWHTMTMSADYEQMALQRALWGCSPHEAKEINTNNAMIADPSGHDDASIGTNFSQTKSVSHNMISRLGRDKLGPIPYLYQIKDDSEVLGKGRCEKVLKTVCWNGQTVAMKEYNNEDAARKMRVKTCAVHSSVMEYLLLSEALLGYSCPAFGIS